jgi:hypothetical protein
VVIPQTGQVCRLGTTGVKINGSGITLEGNNVGLTYSGTGIAVDIVPTAVSVFRQNVVMRGLGIVVTGNGATALRWRASHGRAYNLDLAVQAENAIGLDLSSVGSVGTGPYYNSFYDLRIQGTSRVNTYGIKFTQDPITTHKPNANQFYGGRIGQVAHGVYVLGAGNRMYSITTEGCTNHYEIGESQDFATYSPYLESGGGTGIVVDAAATRAVIMFPYMTGVGTGFTDNGTATTLMLNDPIPIGFSWPVKSGQWTPEVSTVANLDSTPTFSANPQYSRTGAIVIMGGMAITEDPTTAGAQTTFSLTLPYASNFTNRGDASGTCTSDTVSGESAAIYADSASDRLYVDWKTQSDAVHALLCTAMYRIK